MEKLANLTQTDVNNGVLNRMLANVGIPDVQEYVKNFHQETEELIIEEFEHPDQNTMNNDEQIVPPADIRSLINGLRPRVDDPIKLHLPRQQQQFPADVQAWMNRLQPRLDDPIIPPLPEQQQQQQQQLPPDVQAWMTRLRSRVDDPIIPPLPEQQQQQPPTDLKNWMQRIAPISLHTSTDNITSETTITYDNHIPLSGNLGTWLNDWSKNIAEQPPPASLDQWLQSFIPKNMHDPIGKANSPKGRLNSYLNAAQEVLSEHGYNVSNEVTPPTNVKTNSGMFGNVKQMYFLWKILDKNNDRKVTVEDFQIILQEMGLGFLSKYVAQTLFDMVDSNHDGQLQFRDFIALMGITKQLVGAVGSVKT